MNIEVLKGKIITDIVNIDNEQLDFTCDDGSKYSMLHNQDCCETVDIEDICGDLEDIKGSPILQAEEVSNRDDPPANESSESYTWTFYKLATIKGSITIRWYGESNGYYSEDVDFMEITPPKK